MEVFVEHRVKMQKWKAVRGIYRTKRWEAIQASYLKRCPRCVICSRPAERVFIDSVDPERFDADEPTGLFGLCPEDIDILMNYYEGPLFDCIKRAIPHNAMLNLKWPGDEVVEEEPNYEVDD